MSDREPTAGAHPSHPSHPSALGPSSHTTPTTLTFDSSPPTPLDPSHSHSHPPSSSATEEPDVMTDDGTKSAVGEKRSAHTSLSTLVSNLPDGCYFGDLPVKEGESGGKVIWVEFPPNSPDNPFYFSRGRKAGITFVAIFFTLMAGECQVREAHEVRQACRGRRDG